VRATIGRLAHERFTDEQVGELRERAQPCDDIEADAGRVARRDFDKARRVPGELVAEIAARRRARGVERGAAALVVEPRQVVQLVEASDGRLVVEGAVWAAMVVGP
jgi:hypothetical protein